MVHSIAGTLLGWLIGLVIIAAAVYLLAGPAAAGELLRTAGELAGTLAGGLVDAFHAAGDAFRSSSRSA